MKSRQKRFSLLPSIVAGLLAVAMFSLCASDSYAQRSGSTNTGLGGGTASGVTFKPTPKQWSGSITYGAPPNFFRVDSTIFVGFPASASVDSYLSQHPIAITLGYQESTGWRVRMRSAGTTVRRQSHGSVLAHLINPPQPGENVFVTGLKSSSDLTSNDRWGWRAIPEAGENLYEIWWDVTVASQAIQIDVIGDVVDFNFWVEGENDADAYPVLAGANSVIVSSTPGYSDTYLGLSDPYQLSAEFGDKNLSVFDDAVSAGDAFNSYGKITGTSAYAESYAGSRSYQGNGIQFSTVMATSSFATGIRWEDIADTFYVCTGETIYDTIKAWINYYTDTIHFDKVAGPGSFSSNPGPSPIYGYYQLTADTAGSYVVTYSINKGPSDPNPDIWNKTYEVIFDHSPEIISGDLTIANCFPADTLSYQLTGVDADWDEMVWSVQSGDAIIDEYGVLKFAPDTSGKYCFDIRLGDDCGFVDKEICVTVILNTPPEIYEYIDTVAICGQDSVCFTVAGFDQDFGDQISLHLVEGDAIFQMTNDTAGVACFAPGVVTEPTTYQFTFEVKDDCIREAGSGYYNELPLYYVSITVLPNHAPTVSLGSDTTVTACQTGEVCIPVSVGDVDGNIQSVITSLGVYDAQQGTVCFPGGQSGTTDTLIVTVTDDCGEAVSDTTIITNEAPGPIDFTCPNDTALFICDSGDVRLALNGLNPGWNVVVKPSSVSYDSTTGELVFYTNCSVNKQISLIVSNGCQTDTCVFMVDVTLNSAPMVVAEPNVTAKQCAASPIQFAVGVSDADDNLASVTVSNGGQYDKIQGTVSFTPAQTGIYNVVVTATDSCGAVSVDTTVVNVSINRRPQIIAGANITLDLCGPEQVCLSFQASDPDGPKPTVTSNIGSYNPSTNVVCFVPDTSGIYRVIATATDSCGLSAVDTGFVTIRLNEIPQIDLGADTTLFLCSVGEICIPVSIPQIYGNSNLQSIVPSAGYYNPNTKSICFTPAASGEYKISAIATDQCGQQYPDSITVTVNIGDEPSIVCPSGPIVRTVCGDSVVTYALQVSPEGVSVTVEGGTYSNGTLTVPVTTSGVYPVRVIASADCGADTCDLSFNVTVGESAELSCPGDTSVFVCGPGGEVMIPVGLMASSAEVTVSPIGSYADGYVTFVADTNGVYSFTVIAETDCGVDTCQFTVDVDLNQAPVISGLVDTTISLCSSQQLCFPFNVTDANGNLKSVTTSLGQISGNSVCWTPSAPGSYKIIITAKDSCNVTVKDTANVTVTFNRKPIVILSPGFEVTLCGPTEVCVSIDALTDPDGNLANITAEGGELRDDEICFTPNQSGVYPILLTATDSCGRVEDDTVFIDVTMNLAPVVTITELKPQALCAPDSICLGVKIDDDSEGPFNVQAIGGVWNPSTRKVCFYADTSGLYTIIVTATDSCGVSGVDTTSAYLNVNSGPVVNSAQDFSASICDGGQICFPVEVVDADGNLQSVIASGATNVFYNNGEVCFEPVSGGVFTIITTATDSCGLSDSDTTIVTVELNTAPTVAFEQDSLDLHCVIETACLPVSISDAEGNIANVSVTGGGVYNAETGELCFEPGVDGEFTVVLTVTDSCGLSASDTVHVSVVNGQEFTLECPNDSSFFICEPDTIGVPIGGIPAGSQVIIKPQSVWYDSTSGLIKFYTNCSIQHKIEVIVTNGCYVDTCKFTITVTMNSSPLVITGPDRAPLLCAPGNFCVPVGVSDADDNLMKVEILPTGVYNKFTGMVCVPIDTSGIYRIIIRAVDYCGASGRDTVMINARINQPPVLSHPSDTTLFLCQPAPICIPVSASDADGNLLSVTTNVGTYDNVNKTVCFTPADSGGIYKIITTASDKCGLIVKDTVNVTVRVNSKPTLTVVADTSLSICQPGQVCIPISYGDIDGNAMTVVPSAGAWFDTQSSEICFIAGSTANYPIQITVIDSCGAYVRKNIVVRVDVNKAPKVVAAVDSTVSGCVLQEVCFPVGITDVNDNVNLDSVVVQPMGSYDPFTGMVCFTPTDTGVYKFIIRVKDDCGLVGADTVSIKVVIEGAPEIACPTAPYEAFICGVDSVCQMISVNPPTAQVVASFGTYANGKLCFQADSAGTYNIRLIANGACASDTCYVTFNVQQDQKPEFTCPADTSMFICGPGEVCRPVGNLPSGANVTVLPAGRYEAGMVCFDADTSGNYAVTVIATTDCGGDTCTFNVDVEVNSAPVIAPVSDFSTLVCGAGGEVCFPINFTDADNNVNAVSVLTFGEYNSETGEICFTADSSGVYSIQYRVGDACGAFDVDTVLVTVTVDSVPVINCPEIATFEFCDPGQYCFPIEVSPVSARLSVISGAVTIVNGEICFNFDTSGVYSAVFVASNECGVDTCTYNLTATKLTTPTVTCPPDTAIFSCDADTVCFPINFTPASAFVSASGPAYVNMQNKTVCVPVLKDTTYTITLKSEISCGFATCQFTVTTERNAAPVVSLGADMNVFQCQFDSICIPVILTDDENNIATVTTNRGVYDPVRKVVCFAPQMIGNYDVIVTATDSCGAMDADTVKINVTTGVAASITCPVGLQSASLCAPGSVCLLAPVNNGVDSVCLNMGSYNSTTKEICFNADTAGLYMITMIAYAPCGNDTCTFPVDVDITPTPTLACPNPIDTMLCVSQADDFCVNIGMVTAGSTVQVSPIGSYSNGKVCFPVDTPGVYNINVYASTTCGADTCNLKVTIRDNQSPDLTLPTGISIPRCEDDTDLVCISGIYATDAEGDPITLTKICGPGQLNVNGESAELCFRPSSADSTYEFCIQASDGCHTRTESFFVNVMPASDCGVCLTVSIDGPECSPVGTDVFVDINTETNDQIGGYDMLITYDASAVAFLFAEIGSAINGWEYFTYRQGPFGTCGAGCPSGQLRLVAIADINDGGNHPPSSQLLPQGTLARMHFRIANDQSLGNQFIPVRFFWIDCGDNAFADPGGQNLYLDSRIFNSEHILIWDEADDSRFPNASRPNGLGAPDACLTGDKEQPSRCVDFINGGICIINPDSIDARGDVNLNAIAYEVADCVVFTNYFIIGYGAFKLSIPGQTAATDVNADGATLTVADLVFLLRVIIGDAKPIPKIVPSGQSATVAVSRAHSRGYTVGTTSDGDIGAAWMTFEYSGDAPSRISLDPSVANMDLSYSMRDGVIKVLIHEEPSRAQGRVIPQGTHNLLNIEYDQNSSGELKLVDVEMSDPMGWTDINTRIESSILPESFELAQNYPNPFNPSTTIELALPQKSKWAVTIYNVLGQRVRRFEGEADAGVLQVFWDGKDGDGNTAASGMYLYQAKAGRFSAAKKMILLK